MNKIFKHKDFNLVVYVEDTDFQGFVYHANYIKYFERARSDFLTSNNISQIELKELDLVFVIKSIEINYLLPAKLGE
ncbi:thioesterase family protein, partial [Gammaproteobacteria bacterium]|nr:thioesterase family protein [Gammaproteobacteria bacterium]